MFFKKIVQNKLLAKVRSFVNPPLGAHRIYLLVNFLHTDLIRLCTDSDPQVKKKLEIRFFGLGGRYQTVNSSHIFDGFILNRRSLHFRTVFHLGTGTYDRFEILGQQTNFKTASAAKCFLKVAC
jgi:hypothetical protein